MKKPSLCTVLSLCAVLFVLLISVAVWSAPGDRTFMVPQSRFSALSSSQASIPMIKQALDNYSSANANTPNSLNRRVIEVRNRSGIIMQYVTAAGRMVLGTPAKLSINSVNPANGVTGLFNNYSVRACRFSVCSTTAGVYWKNKQMTTPIYVQYNKGATVNTTQQYIVGKTLSFDPTMSTGSKVQFLPFSTAAATTYTLRVLRNQIVQTDGEWESSCGPGMTDNAGVCEATFSTR